jgi:hypothetical protein
MDKALENTMGTSGGTGDSSSSMMLSSSGGQQSKIIMYMKRLWPDHQRS